MESLLKGSPKLAQVLAIEKGEKSKANRAVTDLHRKSEIEKLYDGFVRTYESASESGEQLPEEKQLVQNRANDILKEAAGILAGIWDISATKDYTNAGLAKADVVVDGVTLAKDAPVSWLLYMEKELNDVETFLRKLPTLDPAEAWKWSDNQNCYATEQTWQNRTKKVPRNHVKAEATDKHPAQVEVYNEDVVTGRFKKIRYSGAMLAVTKEALLERVRKLRSAVLFAREEANSVVADKQQVGQGLFDFLLAPINSAK